MQSVHFVPILRSAYVFFLVTLGFTFTNSTEFYAEDVRVCDKFIFLHLLNYSGSVTKVLDIKVAGSGL